MLFVKCDLGWSRPKTYPSGSTVYAILLEIDNDDYRLVKIGATKDLFARLAKYNRAFLIEPRLRFSSHPVSSEFRDSMEDLLKEYPERSNDVDWMEYRIERVLLNEYEKRHEGRLPPANLKRGSEREYLGRVKITETGKFRVLDLEPAVLPQEILAKLK